MQLNSIFTYFIIFLMQIIAKLVANPFQSFHLSHTKSLFHFFISAPSRSSPIRASRSKERPNLLFFTLAVDCYCWKAVDLVLMPVLWTVRIHLVDHLPSRYTVTLLVTLPSSIVIVPGCCSHLQCWCSDSDLSMDANKQNMLLYFYISVISQQKRTAAYNS